MARLPSERYLIQPIGPYLVLYEDYTERELVRIPRDDGNEFAKAQKVIHDSGELSPEDKCFAHFWFGYFWAYAADQGHEPPAWAVRGWPKPSQVPGHRYSISVARTSGPVAEMDELQQLQFESDLDGALAAMSELHRGLAITRIAPGEQGAGEILAGVFADLVRMAEQFRQQGDEGLDYACGQIAALVRKHTGQPYESAPDGDGLVRPGRVSPETAADIGLDEAERAHEDRIDRMDADGLLPGEAPF